MSEYLESKDLDVNGDLFGVRFQPREPNDNHICIEISVEDDEVFHPKLSFSSFWIDDLIRTLEKAKFKLELLHEKDKDGDGYEFKLIRPEKEDS